MSRSFWPLLTQTGLGSSSDSSPYPGHATGSRCVVIKLEFFNPWCLNFRMGELSPRGIAKTPAAWVHPQRFWVPRFEGRASQTTSFNKLPGSKFNNSCAVYWLQDLGVVITCPRLWSLFGKWVTENSGSLSSLSRPKILKISSHSSFDLSYAQRG